MTDFGIYIHIPFCIKKCPYCDFNSYAVDKSLGVNGVSEARYVSALISEICHYADTAIFLNRTCRTIFIGGGTPSLFDPESYNAILSELRGRFSVAQDAEVTLEANPGTIAEKLDSERLGGYRLAGINRISMGAQSFQADKLLSLGRIHKPQDTFAAVKNIRDAGFDNFNLDLMFGISGETLAQWTEDLMIALSLQPTHLSVYGLTIEPGTEFGRLTARGQIFTAQEELSAQMYRTAQSILGENRYLQYELSNYALAGNECLHNLGYWSNRDYLGLGAGAHSFLNVPKQVDDSWGQRWSNMPGPLQYIEKIEAQGEAAQRTELLTRAAARIEFFFLGLRRAQGVVVTEYRQRFGGTFMEEFADVVSKLTDEGLATKENNILRLTPHGFLFADSIFTAFAEAITD